MQSVQILSNLNYPIGKVINQELQSSKHTQIAVAFLKNSGIKVIEQSLEKSLSNGGIFEIIVGLDFKTTDPKAMKFFIDLQQKNRNVSFFCYGDRKENKNNTVFHPKIYLFKNKQQNTSIVGSTNLTAGGLLSNFEVNTIFSEKNPIYYSQLQAIYNSIKYTDSLFIPDDEYLYQYSDVFRSFEENEKKANKDKEIQKVIREIENREKILPNAVPSLNKMITEFMQKKLKDGIIDVNISEIYQHLETKIKDPIFIGRFKLDTFRNTVRGEINHNEASVESKRSMKLFERVGRGIYRLTENGKNYKGR
ncbi:HKD family nuclease [Cricetibacter osteomyelitidis]|uniref:HKD family nuclease n=1 Tax=Cricetibacter osteomyelitidis TaxID=1521931 RepID=A0A4R2T1J1_9PAST|nr:phospholipase D-like domain-containing protein [Cricetibacter osteomyelitidis]TCP96000.1 HKD family nuclease [Cricetibacter osteomyelitidis]